jgi:Rrf2 family protein
MRMSNGVEWAAHCVVLLHGLPEGAALSAARLAEYHGVPAPYLAKALQALAGAGIVASLPGRRGGYRLDRPAAEITLLDVVLAVEGDEPAFRCTEIRKRGPSRVADRCYTAVCGIAAAMQRAEAAWRTELAQTTIADLAAAVPRDAPPEAQKKAAAWFRDVLPEARSAPSAPARSAAPGPR